MAPVMIPGQVLHRIFNALYAAYGPQRWWPGETPFEVMVGAVLTQNTAWSNVEKVIASLKMSGCLNPEAIVKFPEEQLGALLRPCGYFNLKARRLKSFCAWYLDQGGYSSLAAKDTRALRNALLSVNGIGPESADDILLYAFKRPVFVIDAYTRRLFSRLGWINGDEDYEELRGLFESACGSNTAFYNEFHALIVRHGKEVCKKRPRCERCGFAIHCPSSVVPYPPFFTVPRRLRRGEKV